MYKKKTGLLIFGFFILLMSGIFSINFTPQDSTSFQSSEEENQILKKEDEKTFYGYHFCKNINKPVCGVNHKTYPSRCHAKCAGVKVAYPGSCIDCRLVRCSNAYEPVCGTDNLTHKNFCIMICIDKVNFKNYGECKKGLPCPCPPNAPYVCAVNGQFYQGSCIATCYLRFFLQPLENCGTPPPSNSLSFDNASA